MELAAMSALPLDARVHALELLVQNLLVRLNTTSQALSDDDLGAIADGAREFVVDALEDESLPREHLLATSSALDQLAAGYLP